MLSVKDIASFNDDQELEVNHQALRKMGGLKALESKSKELHGKSFISASSQQRHDLLVSLEKEAKTYNEKKEKNMT